MQAWGLVDLEARTPDSSELSRLLECRGMDLVEVAPPYDHAEITALAGASLILDYFCLRAEKSNHSL